MAHVYHVETSRGAVPVAVDHHHDHISQAEFERILLNTAANALGIAVSVAGQIVLHRYTYRGQQ